MKVCPDRNAYYNLFDRVVCVRDSGAVPLALKGTIIGVHGGLVCGLDVCCWVNMLCVDVL